MDNVLNISQWISAADKALNSFGQEVNTLIRCILLKNRNPWNYPRTMPTVETQIGKVIGKALEVIFIAGQLQPVLIKAGIDKTKVDTILVDANIMLKNTFVSNKNFSKSLPALVYIQGQLPKDILTIKSWIKKNIATL